MNKSTEKISLWLGLPGLFVSAIIAIGTVFGVFGFEIKTPDQQFNEHVEEYRQFRSFADSIHINQQLLFIEEFKHIETLTKAGTRRVCIRDSYEELALQDLLILCAELGIHRTPNDRGARDAVIEGAPLSLTIDSVAIVDTMSSPHSDSIFGGG